MTEVSRPIFDSAALRRHVEKAMDGIEPSHGHAKLKVTLPSGEIEFLIAARVNDHWLIQGKASFTIPSKDWAAEVEVIRSW